MLGRAPVRSLGRRRDLRDVALERPVPVVGCSGVVEANPELSSTGPVVQFERAVRRLNTDPVATEYAYIGQWRLERVFGVSSAVGDRRRDLETLLREVLRRSLALRGRRTGRRPSVGCRASHTGTRRLSRRCTAGRSAREVCTCRRRAGPPGFLLTELLDDRETRRRTNKVGDRRVRPVWLVGELRRDTAGRLAAKLAAHRHLVICLEVFVDETEYLEHTRATEVVLSVTRRRLIRSGSVVEPNIERGTRIEIHLIDATITPSHRSSTVDCWSRLPRLIMLLFVIGPFRTGCRQLHDFQFPRC